MNSPLIIMDGFEITLEKLMDYNDDEIESINILKDAAATAIYGAKAANGVIVITTKKGRQGKLRVNFSGGVFYTLKPDLGKLNLMNSSEKVDFELGLASRSDLDYRSDYGEVSRLLSKYGQLDALRENGFNGISSEGYRCFARTNYRLGGCDLPECSQPTV